VGRGGMMVRIKVRRRGVVVVVVVGVPLEKGQEGGHNYQMMYNHVNTLNDVIVTSPIARFAMYTSIKRG
jgi:hypothetical protein